jgi:hypothetical protein
MVGFAPIMHFSFFRIKKMYIDNYLKPQVVPSLHFAERTPAVIVKTNEEIGQDNMLGVYIPRLMFGLPISGGAYSKDMTVNTSKIRNSKNKTIGSNRLTVKNYVELTLSINPNIVPPRYVKGENVIVDFADKDVKSAYILPYSYGDTNRRKNDVLTLYVNNFKEPEETMGLHNIYGLQFDTKNQIVSIFTSQNNEEKGVYTFTLNAKDGVVLISDSGKRKIQIVTDDDSITMLNEAQSEITMRDTVINMKADVLNIDMVSEVNVRTSRIYRKADNILTEATEDKEHVDSMFRDGNDYTMEYNKQLLKGSRHENITSVFRVDSPIAGFTGVLTSNQFSISPNAGSQPPSTAATVSSSGVARFGSSSPSALPLATAPATIAALTAIAAKVDALGFKHKIPPILTANIMGMLPTLSSKLVFG